MAARLIIAWILVVSGLLAATPTVMAIGHWFDSDPDINDRYYTSPNYDGSIPPADLLAPTDYLMTPKGAFVAPLWILGAQHQSSNVGPVGMSGATINTVTVHIPKSLLQTYSGDGYETFVIDVVDAAKPDGAAANTPRDIRLMKLDDAVIETVGGVDRTLSDINQSYFKLSPSLLLGQQVTFGGFGNIFTGNPDGGQVSDKGLHWGQNVVSAVGSPNTTQNLSFTVDQPGTGDYRKYEGAPLGGDSGSGIFFRDGWEWAIGGALVGGGSGFNSPPSIATGLDLRSNYDWVIQTLSTDLPAYTPSSVPFPDTEWQGLTTQDWSTTSWTHGVPTSTQNAWVNNDPRITSISGVATAKNLFVGVDGIPQEEAQGDMRVEQGGELQVVDSIYIGVEEGDWGSVRQLGGSVESNVLYVGHYGEGRYRQDAGSNTASIVHVGRYGGSVSSPSRYLMYSGATLNTIAIQIGGGEDAHGGFEIKPSGTQVVDSTTTIVGGYGNGLFLQSGGTHQTSSLILGYGTTGDGTYELDAGNLITATTTVGLDGIGTFVQTGGTHKTIKLVIDTASSYEMSDGSLETDEIHGTIDFDSGTATLTGLSSNKIIDYTNATFLNASNAEIVVPEDSLVFLKPGTPQPFGNVSGGAVPHVVGTTMTIGDGGLRGYGDLPDPVVMTDGGYLTATDSGIEYIGINKGLYAESGASVVTAEGSAAEVYVYSGISSGGTAGIVVDSAASLTVAGSIRFFNNDTMLEVDGTLSVGSLSTIQPVGYVHLSADDHPRDVLSLSETSKLIIRVAGTSATLGEGYDKVRVVNSGSAIIGGELSLELVDDYVPAPHDQLRFLRTMSLGSTVTGQFETVTVDGGTILLEDIYEEQIALAVLYESNEILVRASLPGDFNLDDVVDFTDFQILQSNYDSSGMTWVDGDANGDGVVNFTDYQILEGNWQRSWSSQLLGGGNEIPEPSTLVLSTLALLALIAHARRRK